MLTHPAWRRCCILVVGFGMPWACTPSRCESTPARQGTNSQGQAGAPPVDVPSRSRYTSGRDDCPPDSVCTLEELPPGEVERCESYDRVTCRPGCDGYRRQRYTCGDGGWRLAESHEPTCRCEPEKPPPALADCTVEYVSVRPSESSPTDYCTLALRCAAEEWAVKCGAEHDGTGTSQCDCFRDGREVRRPGGAVRGEGPDSCFAAAAVCLEAHR